MIEIIAVRVSPPDSQEGAHITHVKWRNPSTGEEGELTTAQMVAWLRQPGATAYVPGHPSVWVLIVEAIPPHLRTEPDNTLQNNLLSLPRLP